MEYKQLEYYIAIYEEKNLTAASKKLAITQQGLSKMLQKLEAELGMPLFLRVKNHLIPTEFGELLYQEALRLEKEYKKTMELLNQARGKQSGLRIGFASNVMGMLDLEEMLERFRKKYPEIRIEIFNETDFVCEEKLMKGELDAAFCIGPFTSPAIKGRLLVTESLYGLVNKEHPLAGHQVLEIRDMKDCPVIAADSKNKGYTALLKIFQEKGFTPDIVMQSSDPLIHLKFVEKNTGISIFPEHWRRFFSISDRVKTIPIADVQKRSLYLITNAGRENRLELRRFVRTVCKEQEA